MEVEARLVQGSVLKNMVEVLREIFVNGVNFNFSTDGFSLQAMDPTLMTSVTFLLRSDAAFDYYRCDCTISIGVNLNNMAKILRPADDDDIIIVKAHHASNFATFIVQSTMQEKISHLMMKLVDIDTKPMLDNPGPAGYHAIVKMPSAYFSRICTDLASVGNTVKVTEEKGVEFSTIGNNGTSTILLRHNTNSVDHMLGDEEAATVIDMTRSVILNFGLTRLNSRSFTKATRLSNTVIISFSNDLHLPVVFNYQIAHMGYLRFFLRQLKREYEYNN